MHGPRPEVLLLLTVLAVSAAVVAVYAIRTESMTPSCANGKNSAWDARAQRCIAKVPRRARPVHVRPTRPRATPLFTNAVSRAPPEPSMRPPQTPEEHRLVDTVTRLSAEFVDHVRRNHAADPRASDLVANWTGNVQIMANPRTPLVAASYSRALGRMLVNPKTKSNFDPEWISTRILHELAHCRGFDHNSEFRRTWHFYLRVATTELGWKCVISQRHACRMYSLCHLDQCPRCSWLPT